MRPWSYYQKVSVDTTNLTAQYKFDGIAAGRVRIFSQSCHIHAMQYSIVAFSTPQTDSEVTFKDYKNGGLIGWYNVEEYGALLLL